jgi:hypothetical protein
LAPAATPAGGLRALKRTSADGLRALSCARNE